MIKTISVNLGGIVFQVNEDAYSILTAYLNSLKAHYKNREEGDEIVADIEARFAEIFLERFDKESRNVVTVQDAEHVIQVMGNPQDFDDEPEDQFRNTSSSQEHISRRLYRNGDEAVLGGVCSGLTAYLGIKDPLWMRLVFILIVILGGSGILLYLILWAIVPEAKTTSQKLHMHGKPINVNNVEESIKSELNRAEENIKKFVGERHERPGLSRLVNGIGRLFGVLIKVAWFCTKIFVGFILGVIAFSLFMAFIAIVGSLIVGTPILNKYIFDSSIYTLLGGLGSALAVGVPLLFLMYIPIRLFTKFKLNSKAVVVAASLWIAGIVSSSIAAGSVAQHFDTQEVIYSQEELNFTSDTIVLALNKKSKDSNFKRPWLHSDIFPDELLEIDIETTNGNQVRIHKEIQAHGKNHAEAIKNAESITYNYKVENGLIEFDKHYNFDKGQKWRNQRLKLVLKIPEGKVLKFNPDVVSILGDVEQSRDIHYALLSHDFWEMTSTGLKPLNQLNSDDNEIRNEIALNYSNFEHVAITGKVSVEIIENDDYEILINNKGFDLEENFSIGKESDEFFLNFNKSINRRDIPHVTLRMPNLDKIDLFDVTRCDIKGFDGDKIDLVAFGDGVVSLTKIDVEELRLELDGDLNVSASGSCEKIKIRANEHSSIKALRMEAIEAVVRLSDHAKAEVNAIDRVSGKLNGSSTLYYDGVPELSISTYDEASHRGI